MEDDVITAKFELNSMNLNKNLLEFLFFFNEYDEIKESKVMIHKFNTKKYRYFEGTVNYMFKKVLTKSELKTYDIYLRYNILLYIVI